MPNKKNSKCEQLNCTALKKKGTDEDDGTSEKKKCSCKKCTSDREKNDAGTTRVVTVIKLTPNQGTSKVTTRINRGSDSKRKPAEEISEPRERPEAPGPSRKTSGSVTETKPIPKRRDSSASKTDSEARPKPSDYEHTELEPQIISREPSPTKQTSNYEPDGSLCKRCAADLLEGDVGIEDGDKKIPHKPKRESDASSSYKDKLPTEHTPDLYCKKECKANYDENLECLDHPKTGKKVPCSGNIRPPTDTDTTHAPHLTPIDESIEDDIPSKDITKTDSAEEYPKKRVEATMGDEAPHPVEDKDCKTDCKALLQKKQQCKDLAKMGMKVSCISRGKKPSIPKVSEEKIEPVEHTDSSHAPEIEEPESTPQVTPVPIDESEGKEPDIESAGTREEQQEIEGVEEEEEPDIEVAERDEDETEVAAMEEPVIEDTKPDEHEPEAPQIPESDEDKVCNKKCEALLDQNLQCKDLVKMGREVPCVGKDKKRPEDADEIDESSKTKVDEEEIEPEKEEDDSSPQDSPIPIEESEEKEPDIEEPEIREEEQDVEAAEEGEEDIEAAEEGEEEPIEAAPIDEDETEVAEIEEPVVEDMEEPVIEDIKADEYETEAPQVPPSGEDRTCSKKCEAMLDPTKPCADLDKMGMKVPCIGKSRKHPKAETDTQKDEIGEASKITLTSTDRKSGDFPKKAASGSQQLVDEHISGKAEEDRSKKGSISVSAKSDKSATLGSEQRPDEDIPGRTEEQELKAQRGSIPGSAKLDRDSLGKGSARPEHVTSGTGFQRGSIPGSAKLDRDSLGKGSARPEHITSSTGELAAPLTDGDTRRASAAGALAPAEGTGGLGTTPEDAFAPAEGTDVSKATPRSSISPVEGTGDKQDIPQSAADDPNAQTSPTKSPSLQGGKTPGSATSQRPGSAAGQTPGADQAPTSGSAPDDGAIGDADKYAPKAPKEKSGGTPEETEEYLKDLWNDFKNSPYAAKLLGAAALFGLGMKVAQECYFMAIPLTNYVPTRF